MSAEKLQDSGGPRFVEAFWFDGTRYLAQIDRTYDVAVFVRKLGDGEQIGTCPNLLRETK